jgi:2-C-methyl-D-erythritol 4-phosphate cytidylyltransferase
MSRMPDPSEVSVLIPAAGVGERLGLGPKATLPLAGRPVIDWVVDKARQVGTEIIVACAPGVPEPAGTLRIEGGPTREVSVQRLALAATRPWCLLWDAASPFASLALARTVLAAAQGDGAATPCLAGQVRWFVLDQGRVARAHPGSHAGSSQTPQAYRTELLRAVTRRGDAAGWAAQSTVELFLQAGLPVAAIAGEKLNLKLTTPEDWVLAEALHEQLSR